MAASSRQQGVDKELVKAQVPNSWLLPAALPGLLAALTAACQQGGDAALANRLRTLIRFLHKAQAQPAQPASGEDLCRILLLLTSDSITTL